MNINKSKLFPILPSTIRDSRYQSLVRVRVLPTVAPSGANPVSSPSYHAQGWTISDHPEGKRYAHSKAQAGITIVTEARVADPGVSDQLNAWVAVIWDMITEENIQLQETSHLFLEIHEDIDTCNYYFADHGLRTIFWLRAAVETISVRPPHFFSSTHLQHSLEEIYWIHVELFPENASQYSVIALNELLVSFLHARADALTSETPTFPYTAKQSQEFIELLQCSQGHASSPYITIFVARLWATVTKHRFILYAGEDHCRLRGNQCVFEKPESERGLFLMVISKALFGLPDVHRAEIETLWVDQHALSYSPFSPMLSWRKHISDSVEDLKQKMSWTFTLLGLNVAVMSVPASHALTKASSLLCFLGFAMAFFLLQVQQSLFDADATTAAKYLKDWNTSYGFLPIAIVHSLPQALFIWAFLLLAIQGFWMTFADLPLPLILATFFPVAAVLVIAFVVIRKAVYPRQKVVKDPAPRVPVPLSPTGFYVTTTP